MMPEPKNLYRHPKVFLFPAGWVVQDQGIPLQMPEMNVSGIIGIIGKCCADLILSIIVPLLINKAGLSPLWVP